MPRAATPVSHEPRHPRSRRIQPWIPPPETPGPRGNPDDAEELRTASSDAQAWQSRLRASPPRGERPSTSEATRRSIPAAGRGPGTRPQTPRAKREHHRLAEGLDVRRAHDEAARSRSTRRWSARSSGTAASRTCRSFLGGARRHVVAQPVEPLGNYQKVENRHEETWRAPIDIDDSGIRTRAPPPLKLDDGPELLQAQRRRQVRPSSATCT